MPRPRSPLTEERVGRLVRPAPFSAMLYLAAVLAALVAASAQAVVPAEPVATVVAPAAPAGMIMVERDTLIRLMVLNEVSTRRAKAGDHFVLRVDEPVQVDGVTIIPVGAKAWGEVLAAESSGMAGKGGELSVRLLYVEVGGDRIPISGKTSSEGEDGTTQLALSALALGPLALLGRGNNAKLKAGHIFNAYFTQDLMFDQAHVRHKPLATGASPASAEQP